MNGRHSKVQNACRGWLGNMRIEREPALAAIGVLAPAIQLTCSFLIEDAALQCAINAAAALLAGVLVALLVHSERIAPAILGLAQGILALGLQLGWHLTAEQQGAAMAFVGVVVAAYVRTQVVAPVPAEPVKPVSVPEPEPDNPDDPDDTAPMRRIR